MRKALTLLGCASLMAMSAFAQQTVPWSNDFSNYSASISGWKSTLVNSKSKGFTVSSGELYIAQCANNATVWNEIYGFFPGDGFTFEAGKSYRFDMDARSNSTNTTAVQRFKILVYKYQDVTNPDYNAAHTEVLSYDSDVSGILTTSPQGFFGYFEPEETGTYYLCLYAYANYNARALYFDNFVLKEASMDAPDKGSMTVTPDPNGILKASLSITAPSKTIRGTALTALSKLEVIRDGGVAKTFENPTPGQTLEYTDYVAQPGNHIYSLLGYNEKGAGASYDVNTEIGGSPVESTWTNQTTDRYVTSQFMAKYTPDGKIRIEWPAYNGFDETGYRVEVAGTGRVIEGTPVAFTAHKYNLDDEFEVPYYYLIDEDFVQGTEPIGWQYEIATVTEDGTATKKGTTNYLCLNNQVPYFPTMQTTTSLLAFTKDQDYQYAWQYYNSNGGSFGCSVNRPYQYTDPTYFYKNWLVSPGILLSKDKFYRVKVTGCSDSGTTTYTIKAGKGNSREYFDILVTEDHPTVDGDSYLSVVQTDEMFLSVPEDGQYFIGLLPQIPNNVSSDALRLRRFDIIEVDPSLPNVPTDVTVGYSPTGGNDGKITFKVPTVSINGDEVDGLTKIEVLKDGEDYLTITEGVTPGAELSFDIIVAAGQQNVYAIRAYNAAGQGESAQATVFVLNTPYSNDFSAKSSLNGFTLINNLNTLQNFHLQNDQVRLFYSEFGNDHWLITPPITFKAGQYYQFNYNIKSNADEAGDCVVMMGKAPVADAMTQTITDTFEINSEQNIFNGLHEEWFTVEEDGQYFIGIHVTKPEGRHFKEIFIDDLYIASGVAGTVPDKGELIVTPDPSGELKAKLTYTVPTAGLNGTALNANSTQPVYFYINGVQTGGVAPDGTPNPTTRTFNAYPGQSVSIDITVDEDLPYIFSARAAWNGRQTYQDSFIGINTPWYPDPSSVVLTETQPYGHVKMTWDPVTTDIEGYTLNGGATYEVMYLTPSLYNPDNYVETPILQNIEGTSCEFDAIGANDPQTMKRYVLRARNKNGKGSSGVLTPYVNVGKPYRMPYRETFAGDDNKPGVKTAIFDEVLEGLCHWGLMYDGLENGVTSGDGDGCYLAMESAFLDSKGRFYTGKVNLGSGEEPTFSVMLWNPAEDGQEARNTVEFLIYTYADGKWHSLGEPRMVSDLCNGRHGWNKVSIDLSDYVDNIVFCAIDVVCNQHTFTSFDNIRVWDKPQVDLSILAHNTPVSVAPGKEFGIDLNVVNNGVWASTPESLEMYVDDELVATAETSEIPVGESATFTFTHNFPSVDLAESHELRFKVNHEADEDLFDNEIATTVATVSPVLPVVENLRGSADDNLNVTLEWDAPEALADGTVTESFEDWEPGKASQFGWTSYDADRRNIVGLNNGAGEALVIPGLTAFEPASFAVIDNENGPLNAEAFPANSGSKFLMSLIPTGGTGSTDDWMISPLLSGNAQTIKFFVRNNPGYRSGFQVLYTDGNINLRNFESAMVSPISAGEWVEVTVDLPEGAQRLALRNISYVAESFMLMIDDVTYEPAGGEKIALEGYNVYQEGECLAQPEGTSYTFATPMEEGEYVFGVSARYAHGESKVMPVEVKVISGIAEVGVADGVHVFGGNSCIHITGAEGLDVAVYDIAGHQLVGGAVPASGRIAAAPGVYVVVVDNNSFKVLVK